MNSAPGSEILVCPCGTYQLESPRFWDPSEIEDLLGEHLLECAPLRFLLREAVRFHSVPRYVATGVAAGGEIPKPPKGGGPMWILPDPPSPQVVVVDRPFPRRGRSW